MYAVISDRTKQYTVRAGDKINIDSRSDLKPGAEIVFDNVLFIGGEQIKAGSPKVAGAKVIGKVEETVKKGQKLHLWKWVRREQYQRRVGHRQKFTAITITDIKV